MAPASPSLPLPVFLSHPCAPGASPRLLASPGPSSASASSHLLASSPSSGHRRGPGLALAAAPAPAPGGRQAGGRWRAGVSSFSFLPPFLTGGKGEKESEKAEQLKEELLAAIAPLDRGAEATSEDKKRVEQIVQQLEAVNSVRSRSCPISSAGNGSFCTPPRHLYCNQTDQSI